MRRGDPEANPEAQKDGDGDGAGDDDGAGDPGRGPLTGRVLSGKWRVGRLLGRGGMASVYAAVHRNGKEFAIKALHPDLTVSARAKARFLREGYIANRVGHDGVVSVVDDDITHDGFVFLVMELLEGVSLEEHRRRRGGALPESEVLLLADDMLDVLAATHAKGVVHRDIKPGNVFLTTRGMLKLLDFGVASLRDGPGGSHATRSGAVLGTPGFIAPEQARGRWREIDARTDLWGVGATMFRLLTGRLVHEAETGNETIIAAATQPAPALQAIDPSLTVVGPIVDRALRVHPRDRWQSATEMQAAVRAARARLPPCPFPKPRLAGEVTTLDEGPFPDGAVEPFPSSGSSRRRARSRRGRAWLATGVAAAAVALALLGVVRWRERGVPLPPAVLERREPGPVESAAPRDVAAPPVVAPRPPEAPPPAPEAPRRKRRPSVARRPGAKPSEMTAKPPAAAAGRATAAPARLEDVLDERN